MKYEFHFQAPTSYHEQHQHQNQLQHQHQLQQQHLEQIDQFQLHYNHQSNYQQHYLTIEDIKSTRNSCWLCGCNWLEDHVSLDCPECDGYALNRPCPNCDGKCQQTWTRNISATHDKHKALWIGQCKFQQNNNNSNNKQQQSTLSDADRFKAAAQAAATIITSSKQSQMIFSPASGSPYQAVKVGSMNVANAGNMTIPSSSSCCSSHPSSAATSDEEPDDLSTK